MSKGLEALKRITLKDFILNNDSCLKDIKIIEKELKALEIIKEKKVDVAIFFEDGCARHREKLTQEEYDLLKEVLL